MTDDIRPLNSDRLPDGVIDLAGVRITRGISTRSFLERCKHPHLIYDQSERRVRCEDCKRDVESFDAFMSLVGHFEKMTTEARRRLAEAKAALEHRLVSRAAKAVDRVWSGRRMAPCCPHCSRGLLPEDFAGHGGAAVSRELEVARRKRDGKPTGDFQKGG